MAEIKMTLSEFLAIPLGMGLEEYKELIARERRVGKRLGKLYENLQDIHDALEMVEESFGQESERWIKWDMRRKDTEAKYEKAWREWEEIHNKLKKDVTRLSGDIFVPKSCQN